MLCTDVKWIMIYLFYFFPVQVPLFLYTAFERQLFILFYYYTLYILPFENLSSFFPYIDMQVFHSLFGTHSGPGW